MFNKLKAVSALVIASYASPSLALGIGSIDMHSAMSQPLDASIELYGIEGMAMSQLVARMASLQDFERAGVAMDYHLEGIKFAVELDGKGGGLIRLTSDDPMIEPYLNFVLDLRWPDGRILREYTALVDFLPIEPAAEVVDIAQQSSARTVSSGSEPAVNYPSETPAGMVRVENGDSLWRIALQVRPSREYSPQQTMRALVKKNQNAFLRANINGLQAGVLLRVPSAEEIASASKEQASAWVASQNRQWDNPQLATADDDNRNDSSTALDETPKPFNEAYLRLANAEDAVPVVAEEINPVTTNVIPASADAVVPPSDIPVNEELNQRLATTLEDLDKSQRQNDEMADRLAALEEQVKTMQRLMVLKDQELAKMQVSSPAQQWWQSPMVLGGVFTALLAGLGGFIWARKRRVAVQEEPQEVINPVAVDTLKDLGSEPPVKATANVEQSARKAFAAEVVQEITAPVNPSPEPVVGDQSEDPVSDLEDFTSKGNEVEEALVEIDIYVAYGRAAAALDLAKDLANNHPENDLVRLKVMEVAAIVGDLSNLDNVRTHLDASTDPDTQAAWSALQSEHVIFSAEQTLVDSSKEPAADSDEEEVAEHLDWDIGQDTNQPGESKDDAGIESSASNDDDLDVSEDLLADLNEDDDLSTQTADLAGLDESVDLDNLDVDLDAMEVDDSDFLEDEVLSIQPDVPEDLPDLDFDDLDLESEVVSASHTEDAGELVDMSAELDDEFDLDSLAEGAEDGEQGGDFGDLADLDLSELKQDTELDSAIEDDLDLADLEKDFMLDSDEDALDDIISGSLPEDDDLDLDDLLSDFDEIDTKLELAKAYVDMGDAEGVRDILEEVILDGNDEQKSKALALKEQLT